MPIRRKDTQVFHLDHYGLTVNSDCYLITICDEDEKRQSDPISALPEWIFDSSHAIWLTEEEKPIADRARSGDKIRKQLLALKKCS